MSLLRFVLFVVAVTSMFPTATSRACNQTELLAILKPLQSNSHYAACSTNENPCVNSACKALITPLAALDLPNCTVTTPIKLYNPIVLKGMATSTCDSKSTFAAFLTGILWEILKLMKD